MDELDGRDASRELAVLRPGRRLGDLPALRHHQTRHRELEPGAQEVHEAAQVHGEAGELQLRGRAWQDDDEFLAGRHRRPGHQRRERHADTGVDLAIDEIVHAVCSHVAGRHPGQHRRREGDRSVGELEAANGGQNERDQRLPGLDDSRWESGHRPDRRH